MRTGIHFTVTSGDRQRLQAIVADPKSSQKHVWRARIILKSDEGLGNSSIMAETGKSKTCVWRWVVSRKWWKLVLAPLRAG